MVGRKEGRNERGRKGGKEREGRREGRKEGERQVGKKVICIEEISFIFLYYSFNKDLSRVRDSRLSEL